LKNVELLRNRECYNTNCSSAKNLGVEAWKRGAVYWGYKDIVYFTTDALEEFQEAFNYGIKRRVDGLSWEECLEKAKKRMTELADKLVEAGKALAASCMRHNRDILVCYDAHPPEPVCRLRALAVKLLGRAGWRVSRGFALSMALFFMGFGVALHDFTHALWEVGGYPEILSWQGGYVGYTLMLIGFILVVKEHIKWIAWKTKKEDNK